MPHRVPPRQKKRGPLSRASSPWPLRVLSAVTAAMMMRQAAMAEADRLELEPGDTGRDIQSSLALHADRLQRIGVALTTDQEIAAAADADRRIGADAAIGAGEIAVTEPRVRCIDRPGELGLRGDADIDAEAAHGGDIGFGPAARALEHAFEARDRTDDKADILAAAAGRQRLRAGERACQRGRGNDEG